MTIHLPKGVSKILHILNTNGHAAYIVGGCVRDALMGSTPKDFDITTSATPSEIKAAFHRTIDTGIKHGTLTVPIFGKAYEVTTFRIDGDYKDNRRPAQVSFTKSLTEDLSRRDFTMNAIAYHPAEGYIDPFGGTSDIAAKLIKGVGEPLLRFEEDALRILRALRFCAQLGFLIEPATMAALAHHKGLLAHISAERIRDEICKILISPNFSVFSILLEEGLWEVIDPASLPYFKNNFATSTHPMALCDTQLHNRLALWLIHEDDAGADRLLKRLVLPTDTIKAVRMLINAVSMELVPQSYEVRRALGIYGREMFKNILYIHSILAKATADTHSLEKISQILQITEQIHKAGDAYTLASLAINGEDLIRAGLAEPGRKLGNTLAHLLDKVQKDPSLNTYERLMQLCASLSL